MKNDRKTTFNVEKSNYIFVLWNVKNVFWSYKEMLGLLFQNFWTHCEAAELVNPQAKPALAKLLGVEGTLAQLL